MSKTAKLTNILKSSHGRARVLRPDDGRPPEADRRSQHLPLSLLATKAPLSLQTVLVNQN